MGDTYVVAIKPSARRACSAAGKWVLEHGRHRSFETRALAREWARTIAPADRTIWVQDAHPLDGSDADGYLLARRRTARRTESDGPGEQSSLTGE